MDTRGVGRCEEGVVAERGSTVPTPKAWQSSLDVNAKEIIGVRLYNELSASSVRRRRRADRETYWGSDVTDEGGMSDLDAVTQLDSLEKAEAIWSSKLKEQQTIDSFQTVKGWSHGSRPGRGATKRLRNSSTYRKVLYARYPNVELTSLQQMKIQRNDDVALAALAAYSRCLVRVAADSAARSTSSTPITRRSAKKTRTVTVPERSV